MDNEETQRVQQIANLLATISHEFRGPLTSVKGYAATLLHHEERLSREERQEFLQAIVERSERLEKLVHRSLLLAELEKGLIDLQYSSLPLLSLLREVVATFSDGLPTVTLEKAREEENEMVFLWADRRRLQEAFLELIDNARKYSTSPQTPVVLSVHLAHDQPSNNRVMPGGMPFSGVVEVLVRDRGAGIAPEHLPMLFEAFARLDTSLTQPIDGLGIGLTISQKIIHLHGGKIWIESTVGTGTTLHVLLPCSVPSQEEGEKR